MKHFTMFRNDGTNRLDTSRVWEIEYRYGDKATVWLKNLHTRFEPLDTDSLGFFQYSLDSALKCLWRITEAEAAQFMLMGRVEPIDPKPVTMDFLWEIRK